MFGILTLYLSLALPTAFAGEDAAAPGCPEILSATGIASDPRWMFFSREDLARLDLETVRGLRVVGKFFGKDRLPEERNLDGVVTQVRLGRGGPALSFLLSDGRVTIPLHDFSEFYLYLENQQSLQSFEKEFSDYALVSAAELRTESTRLLEGKRVAVLLPGVNGQTVRERGLLTNVVIHSRYKPRWGMGNSRTKRDSDAPKLPFRISFTLLRDDQSKLQFSSDDLVQLRWRSINQE